MSLGCPRLVATIEGICKTFSPMFIWVGDAGSNVNRIRTENDLRIVEEADYKGHHIKVVCGYNVSEDNFLVHLYISPPGGPEVRVFDPPRSENTIDDALSLGFYIGREEVDQLVP